MRQDSVSDYLLNYCYFTIEDNIDNKKSIAFMTKHPTAENALEFSRINASYQFIVYKDGKATSLLMLKSQLIEGQSVYTWFIIDPMTRTGNETPSKLTGDVTEMRAYELAKAKYDKSAEVKKNADDEAVSLEYDGKSYSVQPFEDVKAEAVRLIEELQLDQ